MVLPFSPVSGTRSAESNDLGFFSKRSRVHTSSGNAERDKLLTRRGAVLSCMVISPRHARLGIPASTWPMGLGGSPHRALIRCLVGNLSGGWVLDVGVDQCLIAVTEDQASNGRKTMMIWQRDNWTVAIAVCLVTVKAL